MPSLRHKALHTNHGSVLTVHMTPCKKKDAEDVCAVQQDLILQSSPSRLTPLLLQMILLWMQEP